NTPTKQPKFTVSHPYSTNPQYFANQWTNYDGAVWPVSQDFLINYITLLHKTVTPPTIMTYLSALKYHHSRNHYDWSPIRSDPLVLQLLKTIEATHTHKPINQKSYITHQHLLQIQQQLNANNNVDTLFWAITLSVFYVRVIREQYLRNDPTTTNQKTQDRMPTTATYCSPKMTVHGPPNTGHHKTQATTPK
ncbi:1842_t:CDS:2, partial [Racocetra persica]